MGLRVEGLGLFGVWGLVIRVVKGLGLRGSRVSGFGVEDLGFGV